MKELQSLPTATANMRAFPVSSSSSEFLLQASDKIAHIARGNLFYAEKILGRATNLSRRLFPTGYRSN
jgi:hypothetical protein